MAVRFERLAYIRPGDGDEFFNREWWAIVATWLKVELKGSVPVIKKRKLKVPADDLEDEGVDKKEYVVGWRLNAKYLERLPGWKTFHSEMLLTEKQNGPQWKLLVLLYCLYHQRMTAQAIDIAEQKCPMLSFMLALR